MKTLRKYFSHLKRIRYFTIKPNHQTYRGLESQTIGNLLIFWILFLEEELVFFSFYELHYRGSLS